MLAFNKKAITKSLHSNAIKCQIHQYRYKSIQFLGRDTTWEIKENSNNSIDSKKLKYHSKIYEEIQLELKNNNVENLESTLKIFTRDLRDNFDRNLQYDKAGEFFVREMKISPRIFILRKMQRYRIKASFCSQTLSPYAKYISCTRHYHDSRH